MRVEVQRGEGWVVVDDVSPFRWRATRGAWIDDVFVPHRFRATVDRDDGPTVRIHALADAELVVETVEVTRGPGRPSLSDSREWSKVHVPTLLEAAIQRIGQRSDTEGRLELTHDSGHPVGPSIDRALRANRRRRPDVERAVRVYRRALDDGQRAPRLAVADALDVSPRTASRLISDARDLGILPPTTPGRPRA